MNARQMGILGVLALIWGSSFLFIKLGVAEMPPLMVVAARVTLGLLFLSVTLLVRGGGLPRRALWRPLLVVALVNNVIPWTLLAWGEQYVASGLASILNATTPLASVVLASTWGDETFSLSKLGGLLLGFAGVVLLIGADLSAFFTTSNLTLLGELGILGSAIFYAVGAVYARRTMRGESPLQLATGQLAIATLLILPWMLLPSNWPTTMPSLPALAGVGALGLFGSGLAYLLFYHLLEQVGATRTVVVTYLLPLVAVFLGWLVLGESITWQTVAGMALILGGIGLVNDVGWRRMWARGAPV